MTKRWRIEGYDGTDLIFEGKIPARFSEPQVVQLLARLHCRHLTDDEIVAHTEKSDGPQRTSFMVRANYGGKRRGYMTNGNPHYVAWYENDA